MLLLRIPLEPVTKKNSQQIIMVKGRPIIIPSKKYKQYEKECEKYIDESMRIGIDCAVNVECHFYLKKRLKYDLTNLLEAIDDVLVHTGVLKDDNYTIIAGHDGSRVHYDKEEPRTVVYITEIGEKNDTN